MAQTKFGVGYLIGTAKVDNTGAALANPQSFRFGVLQEISTDFSFETKMVYGATNFAEDFGRGKAKLAFSAKTANIDFDALAALHFGLPVTTGFQGLSAPEVFTAAATVTVTPPSSGVFVSCQGITDLNGNRFTRVTASPTVGQYSVTAGGVYTFNASDVGRALVRMYEYKVVGAGSTFTMTASVMGNAPEFSVMLLNDSKGSKQAISLQRCVSDKLTLPFKNDDFVIADFGWEALANAAGSVFTISRM